jgi:flagellar basal-body rod modification protein FlgD
MTTPVSGISPSIATGISPTAAGSAGDVNIGGLNINTFLQLLVAQLTHQDPMNPTDSSTYIAEEAQFAMVQTMNTLAKQNAAILQSQQMQQATTLIGKSITYIDPNGAVGSGVVSSASPGSNGVVVRVNGAQVPISSITQVAAAATA